MVISSNNNSLIKQVKRLLTDKQSRYKSQTFFVDGVNFVHQARTFAWEMEKVFFVQKKIDSDFKKQVLNSFSADKLQEVSLSVYEPLSVKKDIQGIGALVRMRSQTDVLLPGMGVVLERPQSPGNLGTILRTLAAFDINNLYLITPAADPFSPEAVRASMGGLFAINLVFVNNFPKWQEYVKKSNYQNIGTSLQSDAISLYDYHNNIGLESNTLLWFGNEAKGLSPDARKICGQLLKILISSKVDSLNLSESVAVLLATLLRRKSAGV